MSGKLKILFLCTGNSCRSQMAEGWTNHLHPDSIAAFSAGVEKNGVDDKAVAAMARAGVDISGQQSKLVEELPADDFDYVITLCSNAAGRCPHFPGLATVTHRGFDDPPALAADVDSEAKIQAVYDRVREEIREFVAGMPGNLPQKQDVLAPPKLGF